MEILVLAQLYQWMVNYYQEGKHLEEHFEEVFSEIQSAGYAGCEGMLSFVETEEKAERVKHLLQNHQIVMPSVYSGGALHQFPQAQATLERILSQAPSALKAGVRYININPDPIGREKTEEELATQAQSLNQLAHQLREIGLELLIHHHDPEMRSQAREFKAMAEQTDPLLVGFCLDLHWAYRGGMNPTELLEAYLPRVKALHLRNSLQGIWSEALGEGDIDYSKISTLLQQSGWRGLLIVELAYETRTVVTRSLAENYKISRQFVRNTFGA